MIFPVIITSQIYFENLLSDIFENTNSMEVSIRYAHISKDAFGSNYKARVRTNKTRIRTNKTRISKYLYE